MTFKTLIPVTAILALALPAAQASAAPKSKLRFSQATYVAGENQGTLDVVVTRVARHGPPRTNREVSVDLQISGGSATNGTDYSLTPSRLTFAANQAERHVAVGITQDSDIEGVESIDLKLSGASGGAQITNPRTAQVLIADDDGPTQLQVVPGAQSVTEAAGTATFYAVRSGATVGTTTVDYDTSDLTATDGADYTGVSGVGHFTFAAADFSKAINVPIIDDTTIENPETFNVTLSNLSSDATFVGNGSTATAVGTIVDNDSPPIFVLDASSYSVNENGSVDVTVKRLGDISAPTAVGANDVFSVDWLTTDGSATNPADYVPVADTGLDFDSSDSEQTITISSPDADSQVHLIDDSIIEGNETFGLALANPASSGSIAPTLGDPSSATVTVVDNDAPAVVVNSGTVNQPGGTSGDAGGAQVVLGARQTGCALTVKAAKKQKKFLKKKVLVLKLKAARQCQVTLRGTIGKLKSKKVTVSLKAGKAKTIKLKFSKKTFAKVAKKLRPKKLLKAAIKISERDTAAKTKSRTVRVKVAR
jgi:hypothetical protein